jgi:hypothetical protein
LLLIGDEKAERLSRLDPREEGKLVVEEPGVAVEVEEYGETHGQRQVVGRP